ncbi:hydroxymethylglutaryl-CoA lyase [Microlunatus parietis]|uniref:Hydroxymethylglutaryl-CoA lyase n=1 Tax=Microlunatus parietis TaxID=682979 RepID=A0A7Y9I2Z9_9ACTN|nr:hydroxymethylglutaryl-CoA lyase [Microlunatus parietis]NYE69294.1 hydroxymethylglutaryl-CoA lyase [Microlunatus parietis]
MTEFPSPYPMAGLPDRVDIYEVGPRDGLQAEPVLVDPATKIEFIRRLAGCGLRTIEATSFVSPKRVPQLADADQVLTALDLAEPGLRYPVLVPNERGLDRAVAAGARDVAVFVSATERFAAENLGTTRAGAIELAAPVVRRALADGLGVRGYVSMCFGDPWEGSVEPGAVADVVARLAELGVQRFSLGDTIGVGTAGQVAAVLAAVDRAGVGRDRIALHFHDTYGQALANVVAGLAEGITEFDASAGGLGGCPFAKSATGNLATEDLVWLLHGLGYRTGVDLPALAQVSRWLGERMGRAPVSRVVAALTGPAENTRAAR